MGCHSGAYFQLAFGLRFFGCGGAALASLLKLIQNWTRNVHKHFSISQSACLRPTTVTLMSGIHYRDAKSMLTTTENSMVLKQTRAKVRVYTGRATSSELNCFGFRA